MRLTRRDRLILYAPLVVVLSGWLIVPALLGLGATLTNYAPTELAVRWVGLRNFAQVLGDRSFAAAIRNILVFTLVAVPLQLGIGFGLAFVLRRPFRGRVLARVLLLIPWLVSPVASGVMWHFVLGGQTGLPNFAIGWLGVSPQPSPLGQHGLALATLVLVETWRVAPLVAFLLLPGLMSIPHQRWEDATLDGLGWIGNVRHVALPAIAPLVLAVAMLLIGGALATFDSVLTMTGGGPGSETVTPALYSYEKAFTVSDWPVGAASGWLIGGAVLVVGLVYVRLTRRMSA
jgi:multiple sugar transport system permease protein